MDVSYPAELIDSLCAEFLEEVRALRRSLHEEPELGWAEHKTQRRLRQWLEGHGLVARSSAETGLRVDLGTEGTRVLYRGDIDALPIPDGKPLGSSPCFSKVPGVSHACGHDLHASIAAGLAVLFHRVQEEGVRLPGSLRVAFQPAEEVHPSGAEAMVVDGALDGVCGAFALHCDPLREVGTVGLRAGALTATSDGVRIEVHGEEGHAARPHLAKDAIAAAAEVVRALRAMMEEAVDPLDPAVLSICTVRGGEAGNVIADHVVMTGTMRTFSPETRQRLQSSVREVAAKAASLQDCTAEISFQRGAPTVVNDADLDGIVERAARAVVGDAGIDRVESASTGAEDFGYFSQAVPSYMMRLGVLGPGCEVHHLHTSKFNPDEGALEVGLKVMARALWARMASG